MCLEIIAIIGQGSRSRISARRLSEESSLVVTTQQSTDGSVLHFSVTGGCSCDFLSDDASFDDDVWKLQPEYLPKLAKAVSLLVKECKSVSFRAHWLNGGRAVREVRLSGDKLVKLITNNQVGNDVLYRVGPVVQRA